jgi:hypothetical protein
MDTLATLDCNPNIGVNDLCSSPNKNSDIEKNLRLLIKSPGSLKEINSSDTNSSYKNNVFEQKDFNSHIILKTSNKFVTELFKNYSEYNCLCNYSIFEKTVDIYEYMSFLKSLNKKITLSDYFDCFNKVSVLSLDVPFIEKNGSVTYNFFNPTLSSMVLMVKKGRNERYSFNDNWSTKENIKKTCLPNNLIKYEFYESNPPYNRDVLNVKINNINKLIGKKGLTLDKIIKDKSYFCLLWTPCDTNKNNSSFLSYYSFDFKLIGILIIKRNDCKWFTSFSNNIKAIKDFKTDYLNNINKVENFIKNCNQNNGDSNFERKFFSQDYKRYIYNS